MKKPKKLPTNILSTDSIALIMGSEDKGIQKGLLKVADDTVKLPMSEQMDSLNVSVACGVMLYEIHRQQNFI